ncbi:MAG: cysteine--tRNA ligase [Thiotrichales bacterium]|nr:MAG: cysteine--tRNA ligase [Thiotrichales bacterium]
MSSIHIYNSQTKQKEVFKPIHAPHVGMYVCGITVYDFCHIGHARVMVGFDMIVRHLRSRGYDVKYVRNITDIDDKIIHRAIENGESTQALTERFIQAMHEDEAALNVLRPDVEPKATEYIGQITDMVQTLVDKGFAYAAANGDVYFRVEKFAEYGKLSGKKIEDLQSGARVDVNEQKESPLDFVLWKASKPSEPHWHSPWGEGRPGWHIECSAMSKHTIGEHLDIHGGGHDLQFPHHENEIAQSECAHGHTYVNTWMHVGFVNVDNEKMSKSLGNFFTIRDVLKVYPAEVIRFFLLSSHYRNPLNYTTENLDNARAALRRLYGALDGVNLATPDANLVSQWTDAYNAVMDDDFNTPQAFAVLFDLATEVNKAKATKDHSLAGQLAQLLVSLGNQLGILTSEPSAFLQGGVATDGLSEADIQAKIEARLAAKKAKDFTQADSIRNELKSAGIEILDTPQGTTWRRI